MIRLIINDGERVINYASETKDPGEIIRIGKGIIEDYAENFKTPDPPPETPDRPRETP